MCIRDRLIMVPVLVFFFYLPGQFGDWLTCGIFVLASFTDFVDGFLARLLKQQTKCFTWLGIHQMILTQLKQQI